MASTNEAIKNLGGSSAMYDAFALVRDSQGLDGVDALRILCSAHGMSDEEGCDLMNWAGAKYWALLHSEGCEG